MQELYSVDSILKAGLCLTDNFNGGCDLCLFKSAVVCLFICVLSKDALSNSDYIVSNGKMNDELERMWKEAVTAYSRKYLSICPEGLQKTTEYLSHDSKWPGYNTITT
jgi:hypothetical protein